MFRIIKKEIVELYVKPREPLWVITKEIRDRLPGHGMLVRFQRGQSLFQFMSSHASPQAVRTQASRFKMAKSSADRAPRPNREKNWAFMPALRVTKPGGAGTPWAAKGSPWFRVRLLTLFKGQPARWMNESRAG
jgi:hypothetical protein